jgi:transposase InsO family protein
VLTGRGRGNLFYLDNAPCVTAGSAVAPSVQQLTKAWECHRRLGHVGFRRLADLKRKCLLGADDPSPAAFVQARKQKACEPCVLGKLRRVSHPPRVPHHVRPLHRLHVDLGDLPHGGYLSTVIDEGTRFAVVAVLQRKSDAEIAVRNAIEWFECKTDLRVQRVRSDRGGEYMGGHLIRYYEKKGIQREQGPGYSPEVNGLAERHQLTMQDVALPSLADSADERHGLKPLGDRFAGYALVYANDLYNTMPVSGATVGRTPNEGQLGRHAMLGVFRCFGCRCWVHTPGKPFVHRRKFEPRARPGRILGFDKPFGSGIYKLPLDSGKITQSQTVVFDDAPHVPPPVLLPEGAVQQQARWAGEQAAGEIDGDSDSDSKDEVQVQRVHAIMPPVPPTTPSPGASDDSSGSADEVELHRYPAVPTVPAVAPALLSAATPAGLACRGAPEVGRPVRATQHAHPHYASAAVRVPAQGVEGTPGKPVRSLRVPEQGRTSVHMAPSRLGSVTWHGLADSAKGKTRSARAQARRRMRREVTNAVKGRQAAKARGKQEPAKQGAVQSGSEWTQKCQEVNGDIGEFAAAVATTTRTVTHCLRVQWLRPFLAKMLTGGKQLLMRSSRRAGRLECGRIASC